MSLELKLPPPNTWLATLRADSGVSSPRLRESSRESREDSSRLASKRGFWHMSENNPRTASRSSERQLKPAVKVSVSAEDQRLAARSSTAWSSLSGVRDPAP